MFKKLFAGKKSKKPADESADAKEPASDNATVDAAPTDEHKPLPKFCPHCGKMLDGRFCGGCGYDTDNIGKPSESKAIIEKYKDTGAKVKYWIGVGVCAVMFVITLVTAIMSSHLPV